MLLSIDHPTNLANFSIVSIGHVELAFSYDTCIGVKDYDERRTALRRNAWGPTTGKHLNRLAELWNVNREGVTVDGDEFRTVADNALRHAAPLGV